MKIIAFQGKRIKLESMSLWYRKGNLIHFATPSSDEFIVPFRSAEESLRALELIDKFCCNDTVNFLDLDKLLS
jgi:hypothetical protein